MRRYFFLVCFLAGADFDFLAPLAAVAEEDFLAAAFLTALPAVFLAVAGCGTFDFFPFPKADSQPEAYFSLVPTRVIVTSLTFRYFIVLWEESASPSIGQEEYTLLIALVKRQ